MYISLKILYPVCMLLLTQMPHCEDICNYAHVLVGNMVALPSSKHRLVLKFNDSSLE